MKIRGCMDAGETAYVLRKLLGPKREWWNYLNDVRQGRTARTIPTLQPIGYVRNGLRRTRIPVYRAGHILQFVQDWKRRYGYSEPSAKPELVYVMDDPSDRRHWRSRDLKIALGHS